MLLQYFRARPLRGELLGFLIPGVAASPKVPYFTPRAVWGLPGPLAPPVRPCGRNTFGWVARGIGGRGACTERVGRGAVDTPCASRGGTMTKEQIRREAETQSHGPR